MIKKSRPKIERGSSFRMVLPGEVEHEIDCEQLYYPPDQVWDRTTIEACEAICRKYVDPKIGALIPDSAFCNLKRTTFLDYVIQHRSILLMGSNEADMAQLEPMALSRNLIGWDKPRHFAFTTSTEAIHQAIIDKSRLRHLGHSVTTTLALPGTEAKGFYFGLDYRVVSEAPWSDGMVYLYRALDFPDDFLSTPFQADQPILPISRVRVRPHDWPLLDKVAGVDNAAQVERQWDTFLGYPWRDDESIHPGLWKRPLADAIRHHMDTHFAEPVGLAQLGKAIGCSAFATLRLFRSAMGQSPYEYLTCLRISKAKDFLKQGLPIAEVAAETGFCDQTHLTRHFKRLVGLTPGAFLAAQESPIH